MAENCQALSVVPPSRAIRREIKVATEPVMSRLGPMVVARMAAHSPAVPAGCRAAAAGRLLRLAASAEPAASWRVKLPCSARPLRSGRGSRRRRGTWASGRAPPGRMGGRGRAGRSGVRRGRARAERPEGDRGDQQPREPRVTQVGERRERRAAEQEQVGDVGGGEQERGGVGGDGDGHGQAAAGQAVALGGLQRDRVATTTATSRLTSALSRAVNASTAAAAARGARSGSARGPARRTRPGGRPARRRR